MKLEEVKELAKILQAKGWGDIKLRTKVKESSGTFDLVATSKGVLKKNMLVIICSDIYDAQIGVMLLDAVPKKYLKAILLEDGDPFFVDHSKDISIVTKADDLPGT